MVKIWRVALCAALACTLSAEEKWTEFRYGPVQVYTTAGDKEGRAVLTAVEQFRFVLGEVTGKKDLKAAWPLRIVVTKASPVGAPAPGRDALLLSLPPVADLPPSVIKQLTRLLLEPNTPGLPPAVEQGLPVLFSTLKVQATRVTLGTPPPAAERNAAWALLHMLAVDPQYAGRLRVFLANSANGMDLETASRNAFEKPLATLQKEAATYLERGQFNTSSAASRPINPERDFPARPLTSREGRLAQADVLLAAGRYPEAQTAYQALQKEQPDAPEPDEGLGLAYALSHRNDQALEALRAAVQKNSRSARAYFMLGSLETEPAEKRTYLQKATELNAAWDEPWYAWSQIEKDPRRRAFLLGKAALAKPGSAKYWQEDALALEAADQFPEAARAWSAAERATPDEAGRQKIRELRVHADQLRLDAEIAARRKAEEDRERDIQRAKDNAMRQIREAEDRANRELAKNTTPGSTGQAPVRWDELQGEAGKIAGDLQRIDCLNGRWRLVVLSTERKSVSLLVADPAPFAGKLSCGVQKPVKHVMVEFTPKRDARLGTSGEVTAVEFR